MVPRLSGLFPYFVSFCSPYDPPWRLPSSSIMTSQVAIYLVLLIRYLALSTLCITWLLAFLIHRETRPNFRSKFLPFISLALSFPLNLPSLSTSCVRVLSNILAWVFIYARFSVKEMNVLLENFTLPFLFIKFRWVIFFLFAVLLYTLRVSYLQRVEEFPLLLFRKVYFAHAFTINYPLLIRLTSTARGKKQTCMIDIFITFNFFGQVKSVLKKWS